MTLTTRLSGLLAGAAALLTPGATPAQQPRMADLSMLCEGWAGLWRMETDLDYRAGRGWAPSGQDPLWRVEPTGPGKCLFRFHPADEPAFEIDTSQSFYDATSFEKGRPGARQRGRIVSADLENARAWNIVVEAPTKEQKIYRMQMTMAGDLFVIYMTEPGAAAVGLRPHAVAIHRRR